MTQQEKPLVLVVDDTPENLHLLQAVLTSEKFRVALAPDGPTALRLAQELVPDLVLLDVIMPGMDGYTVCRELKLLDATRDVPVIFVTGLMEREDEARAFSVGAVDFIHKP
ncbi:MAG: response regulator, partial [Hylemonella sp.]|nr:response regulator [Hylemonella sp.]